MVEGAGDRPCRAAPPPPVRCRSRRRARRSSRDAFSRPSQTTPMVLALDLGLGIHQRLGTWPPISSCRIVSAWSAASSGVSADFTPPAFMRPPVRTWDLITVGPTPIRCAISPRLLRADGEAEVGNQDPGPLDDLAGLVFEEPHEGAKTLSGGASCSRAHPPRAARWSPCSRACRRKPSSRPGRPDSELEQAAELIETRRSSPTTGARVRQPAWRGYAGWRRGPDLPRTGFVWVEGAVRRPPRCRRR